MITDNGVISITPEFSTRYSDSATALSGYNAFNDSHKFEKFVAALNIVIKEFNKKNE